MNRAEWARPTTTSEAYRRTGGRRKYNLDRYWQQCERQAWLVGFLARHDIDPDERGIQSALAAAWGLNRSTICRDWPVVREALSLSQAGRSWRIGRES